MKSLAKRWLETLVSRYGYELVKAGDSPSGRYHQAMPTCEERLKHARSLGYSPKYVVDGGAYIGAWTTMVASIFPEAEFLVIEPNPHISRELSENLETLECRTIIVEKALAQKPGKLSFNIWGDPRNATSASLQDHVKGKAENATDVEVDTLDSIISHFSMEPDLVKFDLQGAEQSALAGAVMTLKHAEMFIVEFGCLEAYIDRTTPRQLMDVFFDNGYSLYDVVDFHYRPYDGALTGGDFFFIKNDSPLRSHKNWD